MDPGQIGIFSLAEKRLGWTDRRQNLLAENIANANTPSWRSRDITPFSKLLAGHGGPLLPVQTAQGHMPGRLSDAGAVAIMRGEHAPDGNGVRLDVQLSAVADTETSHELTANLYSKYLSFFRTALGR